MYSFQTPIPIQTPNHRHPEITQPAISAPSPDLRSLVGRPVVRGEVAGHQRRAREPSEGGPVELLEGGVHQVLQIHQVHSKGLGCFGFGFGFSFGLLKTQLLHPGNLTWNLKITGL